MQAVISKTYRRGLLTAAHLSIPPFSPRTHARRILFFPLTRKKREGQGNEVKEKGKKTFIFVCGEAVRS